MKEPSLHILVLTCGNLGFEVAERLVEVPGVQKVTLVVAPYRAPKRSLRRKIAHVWRTQGPIGFARILAARLGLGAEDRPAPTLPAPPASVNVVEVEDFHSESALERIRALKPDLGVVAGTYILRESVFTIPRLGCINLHSGKAPEYRGAAPVFWELYNGEREVGVTIHRVTASLDAGHIIRQECVPIDPAPAGDPMAYIERVRHELLRPLGLRLVAEAVTQLAGGRVEERAQDLSKARTYRSPDRHAIAELKRRVALRRRQP